MIRLLHISSFVFFFLQIIALTFKYLEWEGGKIFIVIGFIVFLLVVVPSLIYNLYKNRQYLEKSHKRLIAVGGCSGLLIGVGSVLKSFSVTGGTIMLFIGTIIFASIFLPLCFCQTYKWQVHFQRQKS